MSMKNLKGMMQLMFCGIALLTSSYALAKEVYLIPGFHGWSTATQRSNSRTCEMGQLEYRHQIFSTAINHDVVRSKQNYYSLATYMGYFSNDPVGKDEIVAKVKPIIDQDIKNMADLVKRGTYFLFVGEPGIGYSLTDADYNLLYLQMPKATNYDWANETFFVTAGAGRDHSMGNRHDFFTKLEKTFKVSPKEWNEKYSKYLSSSGDKPVGARLLVDSNFKAVFAEIYIRESGKTLVSWAAEGQDASKLAALIPETPDSEYSFDICDSLNPEYYSKKNGSSGKPEEKSDDKKKSKPWWL